MQVNKIKDDDSPAVFKAWVDGIVQHERSAVTYSVDNYRMPRWLEDKLALELGDGGHAQLPHL
jgi:hypothetical protein